LFYVLPDKKPLAKVFPDFVGAAAANAADGAPEEENKAASVNSPQKVAKRVKKPARAKALSNP
jgi:hypothetical protein